MPFVQKMKYDEMMYGAVTIEMAKMSGIMPAILTGIGINVLWPCITRRPTTRLAYCTGMRRCACCTYTMAAITSTETMAMITMVPTLFCTCEPTRLGTRAMMPAKMMSETPLPMPFSVINSPSQTRKIVPAVMVSKIDAEFSAVLR